uniref:Uncharacterized protein n=1 Tax=Arundo donax TaxID=35708 RepID=A0A0A9EP00_ARUDO
MKSGVQSYHCMYTTKQARAQIRNYLGKN